MRHTDGRYYITFTTPPNLSCCDTELSFAVAVSENLKDWTTIVEVPNGIPGSFNTWAPEWFIDSDGSIYVIVTIRWTTDTGSIMIPHSYKALDNTLLNWEEGNELNIGNTLDTQIVKIGDTYHAIIPGQRKTATNLFGPWTVAGDMPSCKEAPAVVHIEGDTWRFYCDNGSKGKERYRPK